MDRAELGRLTREELIELVLRLQELVGALAQQQEVIARLEARVAELEAEVARGSQPPKVPGELVCPIIARFQAVGDLADGRLPAEHGIGGPPHLLEHLAQLIADHPTGRHRRTR